MYIPLKTKENYKSIIPLREELINETQNDEILLESAHAFDEQYTWAKKCAQIAYNCILNGKKKTSVNFKGARDTTIKGAKIKVTTNNILETKASIENITTERYVIIEINANESILRKSEKEAIDEIWVAIVHELGHGNIYWKRFINGQNINDTPDEYEVWHNVISNENISPDSVLYSFCYALYSTYYQEIQAFVSQTYSDLVANLFKMYGKTKNITKEEFWNALIKTNTYQVYKNNIEISEKLLLSSGLRTILSKKLEKFNLFYNDNEIIRKSKKILERSKDALKSAYNNSYQWFYKSFQE